MALRLVHTPLQSGFFIVSFSSQEGDWNHTGEGVQTHLKKGASRGVDGYDDYIENAKIRR
jgi:hypothetical protein